MLMSGGVYSGGGVLYNIKRSVYNQKVVHISGGCILSEGVYIKCMDILSAPEHLVVLAHKRGP